MKKSDKLVDIKDVIQSVIGEISKKRCVQDTRVERVWKTILDDKEYYHTKIVGFKNDEISVHVDSPAWLYQMKYRKRRILKKIQEEIPEIQNIIFKLGKVS